MKRVALVPIAWPNMVARAPEKFLSFLRKIRIMKNLNVLVGHAALLIVDEDKFFYVDFGRYITPKGYGRARSSKTDPKLEILTKPIWSEDGKLENIHEVFSEMEENSKATHGENELYASVIYDVDIKKAIDYIDSIQEMGFIPYSGMKKNESNCARFVTNTIMAAIDPNSKTYSRLRKPITIAPTPFFNVVAGNNSGEYMIFNKGKLSNHSDKLKVTRSDVLKKLSYSFRSSKSKLLPSDFQEGLLKQPEKPKSLSKNVKYLGGIGEGAWYSIDSWDKEKIQVSRYYLDGKLEYTNFYRSELSWLEKINEEIVQLTYDSHFAWITLLNTQTNETIRLRAVKK